MVISPLYSSRISDLVPRTMTKPGIFFTFSFFAMASSPPFTKPNLMERRNTLSEDSALRIVGTLSLLLTRTTFGFDGSDTRNVSTFSAVISVAKLGIILLTALETFSFFISPLYMPAGIGFTGKSLMVGVVVMSCFLQKTAEDSQFTAVTFAMPFSSLATS